MNETTQQEASVKAEPKDIIMVGATMVENHVLVGAKLVGIIDAALALDSQKDRYGVRSITFRNDNLPTAKLALAYPMVGAMVINLEELWDVCSELAADDTHKLGLQGIVWHELLKTILHEVWHIAFYRDPEMRELMEAEHEAAEKEAEAWALDQIVDLAKTHDVEPDALAEIPYFGIRLMESVQALQEGMADLGETDELPAEMAWIEKALTMIEDGVVYHDEANDIICKSYRDYLRAITDPDKEDATWFEGDNLTEVAIEIGDQTIGDDLPVASAPVPELPPEVVDVAAAVASVATAEELEESVAQPQTEEAVVAAGQLGEEGGELTEDTAVAPMVDQAPNLAVADLFPPAEPEAKPYPVTSGPRTVGGVVVETPTPAVAAAPAPAAAPLPDSVPLAQNIVEQNAAMAAAAAAPAPTSTPNPQQLDVNQVTEEQFKGFVVDVYMLCYTQIFTKCGWQLQSDQGFTEPGNIYEQLSIGHLEEKHGLVGQNVIHSYKTVNATGQVITEGCNGYLRGTVFSKQNPHGLPAFVITFNYNGMAVTRSLSPQNPAKLLPDGTNYKPTALEARAGHAVAWIMGEGQGAFVGKIRDNVYESLAK